MSRERARQHSAQYIESGDAKLLTHVRGSGPPMVLVHGWALDHRMFEPQIPALSRHFKVIAYDRRGFGKSTGTPDLHRELDDLDGIMDQLAAGPAHQLGVSQGARIALRYALARRRPLRSLVLQGVLIDGVAVTDDPAEHIPLEDYATLFDQGRTEEFRRAWLTHPLMDTGESATARTLVQQMVGDYRGADLTMPMAEPADIRPMLPGLDLPTLILTGSAETASRRRHAQILEQLLPNARAAELPRGGHLCNLTEPDLYNELVMEFCRSVNGVTAPSGVRAQD